MWGARRRLVAEMGREPTLSELAAETGLTPEEIAAAETASDAVASLQAGDRRGRIDPGGMLGTGGMEEDVVERLTLRSAMEELPGGNSKCCCCAITKTSRRSSVPESWGLPSPDLTAGAAGGGPAAEDPVRGRSVLRLLCPRRGRKIIGYRLRKKSLEDFSQP